MAAELRLSHSAKVVSAEISVCSNISVCRDFQGVNITPPIFKWSADEDGIAQSIRPTLQVVLNPSKLCPNRTA
ncbi:hypothetical protein Y032_0956g3210 [Ancylostoma ceylanicum]|uniref:Uncharacterized protein n=1 Tax=Ancylostoma ceylanicum TaxID=53326 RepID=A0A016W7W3_9BILA|nr:hypothetical protein Y032_0956g3210 [Ancylostoma ceylanicum]